MNSSRSCRGSIAISLLLFFGCLPGAFAVVVPKVIHEHHRVDKYATNVFATPVTAWRNKVFVVGVIAPAGVRNGINHRTVVWEGVPERKKWRWRSRIIDEHTLADRYHTQPSIGVDGKGHIHIAYNMHNSPWQYLVSRAPANIDTLQDRGDRFDLQAKKLLKYDNRSNFPGMGTAPIPGNQITYPAFFNDRKGRLYLTYRYALYPNDSFSERAYSSAVARYDENKRRWSQIGGCLFSDGNDEVLADTKEAVRTCPFASQRGWTAHPPRLWFDADNTMHLAWLWRQGIAGPDGVLPSYARMVRSTGKIAGVGGAPIKLPVSPSSVDNDSLLVNPGNREQRYYMIMRVAATRSGDPLVLVSEYEGDRFLYRYERGRGWTRELSPYGATEIMVDRRDRIWAVATGPVIFSRAAGEDEWTKEYEDRGWCYPKLFSDVFSGKVYLHMQSCDLGRERVYLLVGIGA